MRMKETAGKNKQKKEDFFRQNYGESFSYIKESKKFIYLVIIIFLFFFFLGFLVPTPQELERLILGFVEDLIKKTEGLSQWELIKFIFFNNLKSSFVGMFFGIILGIFPLATTLANGYLLGFVAEKTVGKEGIFILWRLFPHGIFELPALFISLGLGLKLGTFIFRKNKLETLGNYFLKSIKVFIFVVVPLLAIAAIIEGTLIFLF